MYDTFAGTIHETTWSMTSVPQLVDHAYQHIHLYSNQYNLHIPLLLSLTVHHLSSHHFSIIYYLIWPTVHFHHPSIILLPYLPLHLHYVSHIMLHGLELYPREVILGYFQHNLTVVIIYLCEPVSIKEHDGQFTRRLTIWLGVLWRSYSCYMLCPQPWKDIGQPPPLVVNHLDILVNVVAPHQHLNSIYSPCAIGIHIIQTHPIGLVPQ